MNTEITKEQFIRFRDAFRARAHNKILTSTDMMLYNIVRGLPASRGFTPITNRNKLANGATADEGLQKARIALKWYLTRGITDINAKYDNFLGELQPAPNDRKLSQFEVMSIRSPLAAKLYALVDK